MTEKFDKDCADNKRPCMQRRLSSDNTCCHYPVPQCQFCDQDAEMMVHDYAVCPWCAEEIH